MTFYPFISILLALILLVLAYYIRKQNKAMREQKTAMDEMNLALKQKEEHLEEERQQLTKDQAKIQAKNKKLWALSERVYKEKKLSDEANETLKKETEKLEAEKQKFKEKNKKLWNQSLVVHKEKEEIRKIKDKIEYINKQISDSILYAERIQASILPEPRTLSKHVDEHFVLFKPRDIVSGDFYWWTHLENQTIITAADCTGHGVPGAFMSMLGVSLLREIVQKEYITHTGVILRKLRREIIKALKQKGELNEPKDGMDMAIVCIKHEEKVLQFSGAHNPLYLISKHPKAGLEPLKDYDDFYEIKADKMPIAIYERKDKFTTHEIPLHAGDRIYMFSDGFADQFGGPKGKKFMYRPFKRLIYDNHQLPMKEQKEKLHAAYEAWRGQHEQIDDVVLLGIKI